MLDQADARLSAVAARVLVRCREVDYCRTSTMTCRTF